ncbi:reverse transcriptase, partial [Thalictrum thalictroides]
MEIPLDMLQANNNLWNDSVIFTLYGGDNLNPNHVLKAVRKKWGVQNSADIVRFGKNIYVCNFMRLKDKERVVEKEPWTVLGHLLIMLPYDGNIITDELSLERVPLWMSVKGLLLQHMHMDTVQMIASAAGEVEIVLPQIIVPRTAEGFRAKVRVLVNTPLIQGCEVNTVEGRKIWVDFKYNNLPPTYCTTCLRLGHDRYACNFPPEIVEEEQEDVQENDLNIQGVMSQPLEVIDQNLLLIECGINPELPMGLTLTKPTSPISQSGCPSTGDRKGKGPML